MLLCFLLLTLRGGEVVPYDALGKLKEGSARFLAGRPLHPNSDLKRVWDMGRRGQSPFAAVLTCADSQLSPELLFDQGLGDLFVVRVAGNVCGVNEMASLEYAAEDLDLPLIFVLGHTHCGAVAAAVSNGELRGSVPGLFKQLQPAARQARDLNPGGQTRDIAAAAVTLNVYGAMEAMLRLSPTLRDRLEGGRTTIFGAVHDAATGAIHWLGAHPDQDRILRTEFVAVSTAEPLSHGRPPFAGPVPWTDLWGRAALASLLLASGMLLGVGLARRRSAPRAA